MQCVVCGKQILKSSYGHAVLCDNRDCFSELFWEEKVEWKQKSDTDGSMAAARIQGEHYMIGSEITTPGAFRGFSGRKFVIKFIEGPHKGKIFKTTNLWYQGTIPERFRQLLTDNAVTTTEAPTHVIINGVIKKIEEVETCSR